MQGVEGELVCNAIKQKGDKIWRSKMNIKGGKLGEEGKRKRKKKKTEKGNLLLKPRRK